MCTCVWERACVCKFSLYNPIACQARIFCSWSFVPATKWNVASLTIKLRCPTRREIPRWNPTPTPVMANADTSRWWPIPCATAPCHPQERTSVPWICSDQKTSPCVFLREWHREGQRILDLGFSKGFLWWLYQWRQTLPPYNHNCPRLAAESLSLQPQQLLVKDGKLVPLDQACARRALPVDVTEKI